MPFPSRRCVIEIGHPSQFEGLRKGLACSQSYRQSKGHLGYDPPLVLVVGVWGSPVCNGHLDYQPSPALVVGARYDLAQQITQIIRRLITSKSQPLDGRMVFVLFCFLCLSVCFTSFPLVRQSCVLNIPWFLWRSVDTRTFKLCSQQGWG